MSTVTVDIHGVRSIKAQAGHSGTTGWLEIMFVDEKGYETSTTSFMPYETALEYASAINACNDREAEEAYVPNENTVHIPISEWRKLNMGVPDASEDTNSNT